jgi:hypothetical protein
LRAAPAAAYAAVGKFHSNGTQFHRDIAAKALNRHWDFGKPRESTTVGVTKIKRLLGPAGMFVEPGSHPLLGRSFSRTTVWPGARVT